MTEILGTPDYTQLFRGLKLKATEFLFTVEELQRHTWQHDNKGVFKEAEARVKYVFDTTIEFEKLVALEDGFKGHDLKSIFEDADACLKEAYNLISPLLFSELYKNIKINLLENLEISYKFISEELERLFKNKEFSDIADYISFRVSDIFEVMEMMKTGVFGKIHNEEIAGYHHALEIAKIIESECLDKIDVINNP